MDYLNTISDNAQISDNAGSSEVDNSTFMGYLSDDERASILAAHEGGKFNDNHDVVNEQGEVILSADDFRQSVNQHLNPEPIDIDKLESIELEGTEYAVNDKGEVVDADGKVVKTREELEAIIAEQNGDDSIDDIPTLIQEAAAINGFNYEDENGNVVEFENSIEGMAARDSFIVNKYGKEIATVAIDNMFAKMPEVKELYEHIIINGSAENYAPGQQKLNIEVTPDNDEQHTALIVRYQKMLGNDEATASTIAKMFIEDGKGEEMANAALTAINNSIEQRATQRAALAEQKLNEERNAQLAKVESIKSIIESGKINDVSIPPVIKVRDANGALVTKNRADFLRYYTAPDASGKTQYELAMESKTTEEKLIEALIAFTGNDKQSLLDASVNTKKIKFNIKKSNSTPGKRNSVPGGNINHANIKI